MKKIKSCFDSFAFNCFVILLLLFFFFFYFNCYWNKVVEIKSCFTLFVILMFCRTLVCN